MMTREKVINGLRDIGRFIAERLSYEQTKGYLRTIDEAVVLLKEQEAVKPIPKQKMCHNGITFTEMYGKCGRCENWLIDGQNYCENCGAKIDWSEGR